MKQVRTNSSGKFRLGHIVASTDVLDLYGVHHVDLGLLLDRHQRGDWGLVGSAACRRNNLAIHARETLTSVYALPGYHIRIVTGHAHQCTTVSLLDIEE